MASYAELGTYIDRTYKVVRQDLINRFKSANIDLTPEQWIVLLKLYKEKFMFQTDLAEQSFKDKPTVSRIVELLSKKSFVKKSPDDNDGRKIAISITNTGIDLVEKAMPIVQESRAKGWENLSEDEYFTLVSILDKVFNNYLNEKGG
ncbi:MAG: MarR family winged helix-turn-helix transcriptional regulator [Ekhidna sp.]